jgi:hypothetical protein
MRSVTDTDREHILRLEKSYFQLRQNSAKKQKTMYDFFCLKKWFFLFSVFPHSPIIFSRPLKNGRSREHCTGKIFSQYEMEISYYVPGVCVYVWNFLYGSAMYHY